MKTAGIALCFLAALPALSATTHRTCDTPFEAPLRQGADLRMELRAGDIEISGSDSAAIKVTCQVKSGESAKDIKVEFDDSGKLRVHGGPHGDVRIDIQVPRQSNLVVQCSAGDLDLIGIRGHKDVSLRAGDLTIDVGDPKDYGVAEASVTAGDIDASAFQVHKGGLFRSFRQLNSGGKYRLKAKLWAGDIKLK